MILKTLQYFDITATKGMYSLTFISINYLMAEILLHRYRSERYSATKLSTKCHYLDNAGILVSHYGLLSMPSIANLNIRFVWKLGDLNFMLL